MRQSRKAPSLYLIHVLRVLLRQPSTVPRIAGATGYRYRTVRAQIVALRANSAVRKVRELPPRPRGGRWAVYEAVVEFP